MRTATVSTVANGSITLVSKLITVTIMYVGAKLVIEGKLTVGQLIAFNMLSGQVTNPIMRLAQLWTDFQQTAISVQRLGDILNTRTEIASSKTSLPAIRGQIDFDQIHFRYRPDAPEVIHGLTLSVKPGEVIGIVGRSGSGKAH